jgi:hypothetical protein
VLAPTPFPLNPAMTKSERCTPQAPDRLNAFATDRRLVVLTLLIIALAARAVQFGNPVVQVDDQFYLLVGDRMWHGALPYVDIWDRKPLGLFLIYGAIRALPGDGVLAYQAVATLFAVATGFVIARIASRFADARASLAAGIVYLLFLGIYGGDAGQSPVFYNLLVALAALCVVRAIERPGFDRRASALIALATTLMGVAMQIKYTAMFEGAFFGLAMMWRMSRTPISRLYVALDALLWLSLALAPTALCWLAYVLLGHDAEFRYANFASIFLRQHEGFSIVFGRLLGMMGKLVPLLIAVALGGWPQRGAERSYHADGDAVHRFVAGWGIAAAAGYLIFGSYYDHYTLPLLVPLSILAAPTLGASGATLAILWQGRRYAVPFAAFLIVYGTGMTIATLAHNRRENGTGEQVDAIAAFIRPHLTNCLYVYDGESALYRLTQSCLPTRWPFPPHLNNERENGAVGIDPLTETKHIMAAKPAVVVSSERPQSKMNSATWDFVQSELRKDYIPAREWRVGGDFRVVYLRKTGH